MMRVEAAVKATMDLRLYVERMGAMRLQHLLELRDRLDGLA